MIHTYLYFSKHQLTVDGRLHANETSLINILLSRTVVIESIDDARILLVDFDVGGELDVVSTLCVFSL